MMRGTRLLSIVSLHVLFLFDKLVDPVTAFAPCLTRRTCRPVGLPGGRAWWLSSNSKSDDNMNSKSDDNIATSYSFFAETQQQHHQEEEESVTASAPESSETTVESSAASSTTTTNVESSATSLGPNNDDEEDTISHDVDDTTTPTVEATTPTATTPQATTPVATTPVARTTATETNNEDDEEFWKTLLEATLEGSITLLKGLRWGLAQTLTASLPASEKEILLERLQPPSSTKESSSTDEEEQEEEEDDFPERGSVAEEMAVSGMQEATTTEDDIMTDEEEKEEGGGEEEEEESSNENAMVIQQLQQELKQAAEARVQGELEIQQYRLEQEKATEQVQNLEKEKKELEMEKQGLESEKEDLESEKQSLEKKKTTLELEKTTLETARTTLETEKQSLESEKTALETEKAALQNQVQDLEKSLAEWNANEAAASEERREKITTAQQELDAIQELLNKRLEQQKQLEIVEQDLQSRAQQVQQAKAELDAPSSQQEQSESVEQDLQIQEQEQKVEADLDAVPRLSPKEYRSLSNEEKLELKLKREALWAAKGGGPKDSETKGHAVLGPIVADLGYKRVHLVSSGKLGTIPIWKKQRTFRNSRARLMAAEKQKSMDLGFPGIICLFEDEDGRLSILDGQHRVGMMQALQEKRNQAKEIANGTTALLDAQEEMFTNVLVEVYPQLSNSTADAHTEQIFLEINKAEPLKLVDMPGVASAADRKIISNAVSRLQEQFPKMFSPSQRCHIPNVNIDNLRNAIFGADMIKRHNLTSGKKLFDWLLVQNAALGAKFEGDEERQGFIKPAAWAKASSNGFYLGLESSWLYV